MGKNARKSYLESIHKRYHKANKVTKSKILDEFCEVCGYHRKYAIKLLKKRPRRRESRSTKRPGRKPTYQPEMLSSPLKQIWIASDYMCGKRLKAALPEWLPHYIKTYGPMEAHSYQQLLSISAATIDRMLKPLRSQHRFKGRCGTKPGTLLKNQIPIKTHHWDVTEPGFLEADTVAHCGSSLAGNFAWSLTMTDILTTWTECRATWNKGSDGVRQQIANVEKLLPFPIQGFDCDNGAEFLNRHLIRYFCDRPKERMVQFTRSRPYHKDDNAHVEQKNWTHVRQVFGYDRLDNPAVIDLMNDLYANEWSLYQNHFCPTTKLIEKMKVNSKYYRRYDVPKTPYQRTLDCTTVSRVAKQQLQKVHNSINPFELKASIEQKLKVIFQYVTVTSVVRHRI